jgi:uncharacterized protein
VTFDFAIVSKAQSLESISDMLLKTELNLVKSFSPFVALFALCTTPSHAEILNCSSATHSSARLLCTPQYASAVDKLNNSSLTTLLITDAPLRLIKDSHRLWLNQVQQCKSSTCVQQQFDVRIEQLNFFTSLNQSLTQHYFKYEAGQIAKQPVHLQIHQLTKDNIKIEALAYRNPNNRIETQTIPFLAYSSAAEKSEIIDNEHDCKYQFDFQKAILKVSTAQKGCERFSGVYRLYD